MNELFSVEVVNASQIIDEGFGSGAPVYPCYGPAEMEQDLSGGINEADPMEQEAIHTCRNASVFRKGDIALSMTNPKAAVIGELSDGMVQTSDFLKIIPSEDLDPWFFVWLINENEEIQLLLLDDTKDTAVPTVSLEYLEELQDFPVPPLEIQKMLGQLYYASKRQSAVKEKVMKLEEMYVNAFIEDTAYGVSENDEEKFKKQSAENPTSTVVYPCQ